MSWQPPPPGPSPRTRAFNVPVFRACTCSHGEAMHDIRKGGTRSACSVTSGPRGTACGCTDFTPVPADPEDAA